MKSPAKLPIFMAWSGAKSKTKTAALHDALPAIHPCFEPWVSFRDIALGKPWDLEIRRALKRMHVGLLTVTPGSLDSGAIVNEAGALAKHYERATVIPILCDGFEIASLPRTLQALQAVEASRDSLFDVVRTLNGLLRLNALSETELLQRFEPIWEERLREHYTRHHLPIWPRREDDYRRLRTERWLMRATANDATHPLFPNWLLPLLGGTSISYVDVLSAKSIQDLSLRPIPKGLPLSASRNGRCYLLVRDHISRVITGEDALILHSRGVREWVAQGQAG